MEPPELSPALLQPQVTVVAILGELLDTLSRRDEIMLLPMSPWSLYWDVEFFTRELQVTLHRFDNPWWPQDVTCDDDSPSNALRQDSATHKRNPLVSFFHNLFEVGKCLWSVPALVNGWAELARKATELRKTCRVMATKAADRAVTATAWARELQNEAARYGTAQEHMGELGQALGGEEGAEVVAGHGDQVRREAREAASEAAWATMVRQQVEAALGLLERLVAACDEATAFPRELQRLLWVTLNGPKGTSEASPDVHEDLEAKVDMAVQLWEANTRLAKDHLLGAVEDIIKFYFIPGHFGSRACEVAERCQRAMEDIPRLVQPPSFNVERPQSFPMVSPVSMEPQELSPALLKLPVTVVATLGELLDILPGSEDMHLLGSPGCLYLDLEDFTKELQYTLYRIDDSWRCHDVISGYDDHLTSLSQTLAAYKSTPGTTRNRLAMAASKWQGSVSVLLDRWAELARKATKLRNTCRVMATKAADRAATGTAQARELQDKAARDGTAQENMVELGQALGGEEGAEVVAGHEAQVRREARVAAREARRATMERQQLEVALGLLEHLVAACDEATAFPRELRRLLRDIEAALEGINEASPNVLKGLVAKVAQAERLWEANARLAKDHLVGAVDNIIKFYFTGGLPSLSVCEVAERCQRAIEDIPRLLRPPERPQSVPNVSPVSMEPQEVSPPQLQVLVAVVDTLGKLVATLAGPHRDKSSDSLHEDLKNFTRGLRAILNHGGVTSLGQPGVPSLRRALATRGATSGTTRANGRAAAKAWRELVARLVDSWDWLAREATKLREKVVTEQRLLMALDKEMAWEMATYDAQVVTATNEAMGEAVVATRRGHWALVALGLLRHLVAMCDRATLFYWNMEWRLRDIKATLKGTNEASPDVLRALMAKVSKFEWLWEASTHLAKDHLLGALGDIDNILLSPGGGPGSSVVTERCQKAIEDIPRLLQESFT
ncbi:uncharacterized protein LOC128949996 isoform X1 [Melozone crissalis]|uniref:uncharacterized protein LOC128949996 isoform X1 n=1 Tax=Melozone crissalis TaxID=40204 RepID=UPI0023DAC8D2|nr:uncharacterized protein LOC128949996 isoform X1 [Melozone crissalis]